MQRHSRSCEARRIARVVLMPVRDNCCARAKVAQRSGQFLPGARESRVHQHRLPGRRHEERGLAEDDGDPGQGAAIRALGRLKAPGAEERLLRIAGDDQAPEDLRMDAAEGLAELQTPAALELLQKLASAETSELSQVCQELLLELAHAD